MYVEVYVRRMSTHFWYLPLTEAVIERHSLVLIINSGCGSVELHSVSAVAYERRSGLRLGFPSSGYWIGLSTGCIHHDPRIGCIPQMPPSHMNRVGFVQ